ncbi:MULTISPECIES: twin-arginine translocase TatA/TatE family subunit [unclassified Streptomyces]|nr:MULTISPECIES: twin-arginine translocase TatA/TatE family subunit [unclassified Streptomyces]WSP59666.1 twin-arginine translocase TatA/TatE family subunit [Streptomyces sp. NBC_01241]WSU19814.1 twin-arginine translocase TatA/TatE family subunit [Streptomyces sp. NBC_01108]MCX4791477.1 twin-arginine translocase TatA/TatE family subunit [Streptomyces sp. NBC_01221]MCX4792818.1 twin-arginine translocase TatA/TatE family subunit [Streptomyces sp. NBC_01242]WSP60737.1 twin-arginine translocase Ta
MVFGSNRLPTTARALGTSMPIVKSGTKAMKETDAGPGTDPHT